MWFLGRERKKTKQNRKKENHQVKESGGQDKRYVEEKQKKSEVPGMAERSNKELSHQHLGHTLVLFGPSKNL